jgi:purine-binding chemotaxis protein CheW
MKTPAQIATFELAGLSFGIDVLEVQEVLCAQEMTRVPIAPAVLQGLINLRGQIVAAIDMRSRLELPPRETQQPAMNIVIHTREGAVSLLVDEIGDVIETDKAHFALVPENLSGTVRSLVFGVYKLKDRLLLLLDTAKAVEIATLAS